MADRKPQWMNIPITLTGATMAVNAVQVPVFRVPGNKGRQPVMEILSVEFMSDEFVVPTTAVKLRLSTRQFTSIPSNFDPQVVASESWVLTDLVLKKTTSLTDTNGNGILVASDFLFLHAIGTTTNVQVYNARLLYRIKRVALAEWVGIVQSQTG